MGKRIEGKCKLCGQVKPLTFEHVPPESAFNSLPVREIPFEESIKLMTGEDGRLPWDMEGLKGKLNQRGGGGYFLCSDCNSNTGSWYISEYVRLVRTLHEVISNLNPNTNDRCYFEVEKLHPLQIFKAIMTMFCDINNGCFGDESLREFLLNKESNVFNKEKYSVYLYLTKGPMVRINSLAAICRSDVGIVMQSEISRYPVGAVLYIDKPKALTPLGLDITQFADCKYSDECNVSFYGIPLLEINTQFPDDYRSKDEIVKGIELSRKEKTLEEN